MNCGQHKFIIMQESISNRRITTNLINKYAKGRTFSIQSPTVGDAITKMLIKFKKKGQQFSTCRGYHGKELILDHNFFLMINNIAH